MFQILKLETHISVRESFGLFGFEYEFKNGLNVICGHNSSGKSSILSCIYYALGMEQLLGMSSKKKSALDKCLISSFRHKGSLYHVRSTKVKLKIKNSSGEISLIERKATSDFDDSFNRIYVSLNGKEKKPYFLHSKGDHDSEKGFYNWLSKFISLPIPKSIDFDNGASNIQLYLQNIFSCSLIEQTKGWSEIYAQMPSFNIKNSKRKLTEFLLSLECFENEILLDKLKEDRKKLVETWERNFEKFQNRNQDVIFRISGISSESSQKSLASIKGSEIYLKPYDSWIEIESAISQLSIEYSNHRKKELQISMFKTPGNEKLTSAKKYLISHQRIVNKLVREKMIEKDKIERYVDTRYRLIEELANIEAIKEIDGDLSNITEVSVCPVCDSNIDSQSGIDLKKSEFGYEGTKSYIKSQISFLSSYIENAGTIIEQYDRSLNYYENKISEKKQEISYLNKDIVDINDGVSREHILKEIRLKDRLTYLERFQNDFLKMKSNLVSIRERIGSVDDEIKEIRTSISRDKEVIDSFRSIFRRYLTKYGYSSNENYEVDIRDSSPIKLFPSVFNNKAGGHIPIRLASSASDFVRSEWAYYLSLLSVSKRHPGIVIFDEPGQHAMNIASMKSLCRETSLLKDRQVILAISKDLKVINSHDVEEQLNIRDMLEEIDDYHMIEIDKDNEKAVKGLWVEGSE